MNDTESTPIPSPALSAPSPNGVIGGRDPRGRFVRGNPGGPGSPHAAKVAKFRAVLLEAVSQKDLREVVKKLIELAKSGDTQAIRLLLDRLLGPPIELDILDRLEKLQKQLASGSDGSRPGT
jgi:hypothetical protein